MNNIVLNDKELREALKDWLFRKSMKPKKIIEELSVNNGLAIADVVAIYKDLHCFEIKGDNDKIERALNKVCHMIFLLEKSHYSLQKNIN